MRAKVAKDYQDQAWWRKLSDQSLSLFLLCGINNRDNQQSILLQNNGVSIHRGPPIMLSTQLPYKIDEESNELLAASPP